MTPLKALLPLSLTLALALPATAVGQAGTEYTVGASQSFSFSGLKVKGYSLSGSATKTTSGTNKGTSLFLSLSRTSKGSTQTHTYSWQNGIKLSTKPNLSSGTLSGRLGSFGKIKLKFVPTAATQTSGPGKGCTGKKGKSRRGRARGAFKLVADKSFFKTIKTGQFNVAALSRNPEWTCKTQTVPTPPPNKQPVSLSTTGAGALQFIVSETSKNVTFNAFMTQRPKNPQIFRSINATTKDRGVFDVADNASSASATGIGPWLKGKLDYTASQYYQGGSQGNIKGDFSIRFDGAGTRRPFTAGDVGGFLQKPGFVPPPPPNQNPTADFSYFESGTNRVTFSDDSNDPDGTVVSRTWTFHDGTTSTATNPSKTYPGPGNYSVQLTVQDDRGGTATVTKTVTVTDSGDGGGER